MMRCRYLHLLHNVYLSKTNNKHLKLTDTEAAQVINNLHLNIDLNQCFSICKSFTRKGADKRKRQGTTIQ